MSMLKDYLKKKELTYLFLDFDGVLNTTSFAKLLRKEGIDHYDEFGAMFDPKTISNLKYIVDHTGCKPPLGETKAG